MAATSSPSGPGQRANVTLEGAEGDRAFLELTGTPAVLYFQKEKLDGNSAVVTLAAAGNVIDIDPERDLTGTVELNAYAVPTDVKAEFDLGAVSHVDQVFATEAPGQQIDVTLTSEQQGRAFVRLSDATVSGTGEPQREGDVGPGQDYHVKVDPEGTDVGSLRVEAWLIPAPAAGDIETGTPADITIPGQKAQFALEAPGEVSVSIQGPATGFSATVFNLQGDVVTSTDEGCVSVTLADSYTLVVDPVDDGIGPVSATVVGGC